MRVRADSRAELTRARNRVSKSPQRHGLIYSEGHSGPTLTTPVSAVYASAILPFMCQLGWPVGGVVDTGPTRPSGSHDPRNGVHPTEYALVAGPDVSAGFLGTELFRPRVRSRRPDRFPGSTTGADVGLVVPWAHE
jgi:hypothetical protein